MFPFLPIPSRATLTIIALYNWDEDIFKLLQLPSGVNADNVIDEILVECGQLELIYPDFDFMQQQIGHWSINMLPIFERFLRAVEAEYNPIENYDRKETRTTSRDKSETENSARAHAQSSDTTDSGNTSHTITEAENEALSRDTSGARARGTKAHTTESDTQSDTVNNTVTHNVAGFNSSALITQATDVTSGSSGTESGRATNTDGTENETESGNEETTRNRANTKSDVIDNSGSSNTATTGNETGSRETAGKENEAETSHIHGNIGVVSAQQMVTEELALLGKINFIKFVAHSFAEEFCVLVY